MTKLKLLSIVLVLGASGLFATACGGEGEVGESCDTSGSEDECVDGAICDSGDGDAAVCLAICEVQEDCATDEDCNGVSGSNIKACHPKDDTPK
jgi:hypothetical protein